MSILEKRRNKVVGLTEQALKDAMPHKYIQGRFLLQEIERRINSIQGDRSNYINQIRK